MQTLFVNFFLLVSFGETLVRGEQTKVRTKHLFVQRREPLRGSSLPYREIYLPEDGNGSAERSLKDNTPRRSKRSTRERRSTDRDPKDTLYEFNDNHHLLIVQWSGFASSDTVVVLTRDIRQTSESTSYLYISNNYGVSYTNQSHKLSFTRNGVSKPALIEKFYTSPVNATWYIFADTTNNVLFTSKDDCKTFKAVLLNFKPSDITFHNSKSHGILAYDDETQTLYVSNKFGGSWKERKKNVRNYFWGFKNLDSDNVMYLEIDNGNGTSDVERGHWSHKHYVDDRVLRNVSDFEINDVYMFATKESNNGLDLYVAYHYLDISKATFPNELKRKDYFIADASEGQVFVAVNHDKNTSHLYISDTTGKKYTTSLERILFYSPDRQTNPWLRRYATESFVDLYPVASMRGVYLASQLSYGKVGTRKISTKISYDKGAYWDDVSVPERHANGSLVKCATTGSCSLHIAQKFARIHPYYWAPTVKSKPSAPGLIVSSGNIGGNLKTVGTNLYVSNDAGESWLEVLAGRWYFNFGDHGGILVVVRQWSLTKELLYSSDEGLTWKRYNFTEKPIHVYGLLTEPGEQTAIFTIFGSYRGFHHWLVVQVNFTNVLGKPCTPSDYETWTPYHRVHGYGCILGQRLEYERRKRKSTCYNGQDYDRPINTSFCICTGQDYECDGGFIPSGRGSACVVDPNAGFDPRKPPRPCPRGRVYNVTRGYRKISGDKCDGGFSFYFEPYESSCPFAVDPAFLMYAERTTIQYLDLTNNNHSTAIEGLRGAVAVAYDIKDNYIYWADMTDHVIKRKKFNVPDKSIVIAGIKQVEGLDFDWTTDNLYWVDSGKKVIEVCRKDGRFRKTIHSEDLDKPRALALDPHMGEMFWSDWGNPAKIEMSDMDGANRKVLIKSGIVWPNGLAIDIYRPAQSRVLYYTDASKDIIGSYDMKTKSNKILASRSTRQTPWASEILFHPYSIAVDDRYVYWDDWQSGKVFKIFKKSFQKKPETLVEKAVGLSAKSRYEIKVYYQRSQSDNSSCTGVKCSQLCLPKPSNKHNCTCGDDLFLDHKTKKCKCQGGLTTLKDGTCKRPSGKNCTTTEFSCRNGYCIPVDMKCDWHNDCGDYSDEDTGCDGKIGCPNGFRCPDGLCIPSSYVCNGEKDCIDGYDEKPCKTTTCSPGQFRCNNGDCFPGIARCDGSVDCKDNSDEDKCTPIHEVPQKQSEGSDKKKTLIWAIPVGIVFAVLLSALVYFVVKSRRLQRSFYRLVRSDSFDHGVTYHNNGEEDAPLIQGFSDDDPLVEA